MERADNGPFWLIVGLFRREPLPFSAMQAIMLHRLFEQTPDGAIRHCGWTGPDREEALLWQQDMQKCFPNNRHWVRPVYRHASA